MNRNVNIFLAAINHIWISGRLNMTKEVTNDAVTYGWYSPSNGKRIPDTKALGDASGLYVSG